MKNFMKLMLLGAVGELMSKSKDENLNILLDIGEVVRAEEFVLNTPKDEVFLFRLPSLRRLVGDIFKKELDADLTGELLKEVCLAVIGDKVLVEMHLEIYQETFPDYIVSKIEEYFLEGELLKPFLESFSPMVSPRVLSSLRGRAITRGDRDVLEIVSGVLKVGESPEELEEIEAVEDELSKLGEFLLSQEDFRRKIIRFQKTGVWKD